MLKRILKAALFGETVRAAVIFAMLAGVSGTKAQEGVEPDLTQFTKRYVIRKPASDAMVRMRPHPSSDQDAIAYIRAGTVVGANGECTKEWCKITFRNLIGWAYREYCEETSLPLTVEPQVPAQAEQNKVAETAASNAGDPKQEPQNEPAKKTTFAVFGLSAGSTLPIKSEPAEASAQIGSLKSDDKGIEETGPCTAEWCAIAFQGVKGYAQRRFLGKIGQGETTTYRIQCVKPGETAEMFDFPSFAAPVVGFIPADSEGVIQMGVCDKEWCHVLFFGLPGWVRTRHLQQAAAAAH